MGGVKIPTWEGVTEVHPIILCGLHLVDGYVHWVPTIVVQSGCIVTEEDGPLVPEWEPASDRVFHRATVIHRHWHADGTRTDNGEWRFRLVPPEDVAPGRATP